MNTNQHWTFGALRLPQGMNTDQPLTFSALRPLQGMNTDYPGTSGVLGQPASVRATFTLALSSAGCNRSGPTAEGTCSLLPDNQQGAILR